MGTKWLIPVFGLFGCTAPDPCSTLIIGHSGMGVDHALVPNGHASIMEALALGVDGVELDVQLTADSVLVAFHDQDLAASTTCSGIVNALTWAQLKDCTTTRPGNSDVAIARVDSLLLEAATRFPEASFTLDCKLFAQGDWWSYLQAYTDALTALEAHPALTGKLLVECQVDPFLLLLQSKTGTTPLFRYDDDADLATQRAVASHYAGITVHHQRISEEQVAFAQGLGLDVALFGTGGRMSHWLALRKRPDRLQTDDPAALVE
jgi:glycerophosphoryl diester phosphodiesterase